MSLFRRAIRLFLTFAAATAGLVMAAAYVMARYMVRPPRQRLWATPQDVGLPYEEVQFPAADGLRLSGWFIPANEVAARDGATVVLVHSWTWNRLGNLVSEGWLRLLGLEAVDLLRLAHALHFAGFNLFLFDLRNHGDSAADPPMSFGLAEANDLLGALTYLRHRPDVAAKRLGVLGFAVGANATLFSLPRSQDVAAAVLVQPSSAEVMADGFARDNFGPLGPAIRSLAERLYILAGGLRLQAIEPIFAAGGAGETPVLFIQGEGDRWGTLGNVAQMAAAAPHSGPPLVVASAGRYGGYRHIVDNPSRLIEFFASNLS